MADQQDPYGSSPTGWGASEGGEPGPTEPEPPEAGSSSDDIAGMTAGGEVTATAQAAAVAGTAAASLANLQGAARNVFFGAIAVAVIGLIGVATDSLRTTWTAIILVLLGIIAAVIALLGATSPRTTLPFAGRYVELLTGLVATVVGIGGVIETIFDLDDLEAIDLVVFAALAAAGLFLLLATGRAWPGGIGAVAKPVRSGAAAGGRLAFLGILLVILGWLVNITVGVWNWQPAALVMFLILVVAVMLLMISEDAFGPRIPVPAAWVAAAVAIWAGVVAFVEHVQSFVTQDDFSPGLEDWLGMTLYAVGIVLIVAGTVMMAINARPAPGSSSESPPAPPAA